MIIAFYFNLFPKLNVWAASKRTVASRAGIETLLKISSSHRFWLSRKRQIAVSGTLLLSCSHLVHKINVFLLFCCLSSTHASQVHVKGEKSEVKRQSYFGILIMSYLPSVDVFAISSEPQMAK